MPAKAAISAHSPPSEGANHGQEAIGPQAKEIGQVPEVKISQADKEETIGADEGEGKRQEEDRDRLSTPEVEQG